MGNIHLGFKSGDSRWVGLQLLSNVVFFLPETALTGVSWFWICMILPFGTVTASLVLAQFVPVLIFFVWNPRLFSGAARVPKRSYALFAIATVLTAIYFRNWSDGMGYQGAKYTYGYLVANIASIAPLGLIFVRSWKQRTFVQDQSAVALELVRMACMVRISCLRCADLALTIGTNRILKFGPSPAREARPLPDRERLGASGLIGGRRNLESRIALSLDPHLRSSP